MATNDVPQDSEDTPPKLDASDSLAMLSRYLHRLWRQEDDFKLAESNSASTPSLGNLQIWSGGFRC